MRRSGRNERGPQEVISHVSSLSQSEAQNISHVGEVEMRRPK